MTAHSFHLHAKWPEGRNGTGTIEAGKLRTAVSIPPEMDGPGIGTNPDELLLGAAATCYIITLAAMLERSGIERVELHMDSEAIVDVTKGVFTYQKIIHRPTLILTPATSEREINKAKRLVEKAETTCMISRALKGNVDIEVDGSVTIAPL